MNNVEKVVPTREHAIKVDEVVRCGLSNGLGNPVPGQMCIEAAVCYALGQRHGDEPTCVGAAVRAAKITLNDSEWSSNAARARGMRRIAIAQLGSDTIDQTQFATVLAELTIREIVPIALRAAAQLHDIEMHKKALEACANRCEEEGSYNAASAASDAAGAARYAASAARYAASAARYAAGAARAARAASAARDAASAASDAASAASDAAGAARAAVKDTILTRMANIIERALVACGSPGVEWLDVIPEEN